MSAICYKCGAVVTQDEQGSWIDKTDGDGCEGGVHQGENVTFLREWLGGSEVLSMVSDYETFATDVVQDFEVADEIIENIKRHGEVIENESEPQYIERYTLIDPDESNDSGVESTEGVD